MSNPYKDILINVLIQIQENIRETSERKLFAETSELDYIEAKLMAYKEVDQMIKMESRENGVEV